MITNADMGYHPEAMAALTDDSTRHAWAETSADARRQDREADREARRKVTEQAIQMLQKIDEPSHVVGKQRNLAAIAELHNVRYYDIKSTIRRDSE